MNDIDKAYEEGHAQGLKDGMQMTKNQIKYTIQKLGFSLDDLIELADLVDKGVVEIAINKGNPNYPENHTTIDIRRA